MRRTVFAIGTRVKIALAIGLLGVPTSILGATSTSYQMHSNYDNDATKNTQTSTTYTLTDAGLTWHEQPLASTSYTIVPVTTADDESGSSDGTSGGSTGGTTGGSSGGSTGGSTGGGSGRGDYPRDTTPPTEPDDSSPEGPDQDEAPVIPGDTSPGEEIDSEAESPESETPATDTPGSISDGIDGQSDVGGPLTFFGVFGQTSSGDKGELHEAAPTLAVTPVIQALSLAIGAFAIALSAIALLLTGSFAAVLQPFALFIELMKFMQRAICGTLRLLARNFGLLFGLPTVRKVAIRKRTKGRASKSKKTLALLLALGLTLSSVPIGVRTFAAQTAPVTNVYNGRLLDSSGTAVTSAVSVRFSYWRSADFTAGDVTGAGEINTAASNYASWTEVHTVTPNSTGHFSVTLGSVTALPDFSTMSTSDLLSLYLQVEVKPSSSANTAYEILDPDSDDPAIDRSGILSVPFAMNADLLDKREIGTGSGNIAILGPGGRLPDAVAPDGTGSGRYTIDADDTESSEIILQFGTTLGKKLTYDITNGLFSFNDDVKITGNLTVTGLINGVDVDNIQSSTGALKALSGGGLNLNISDGTYRLNGSLSNVTGQSITLTANATNYVFFGSGGLAKNATGFPSDESYIPVATVTTNTGVITNISDRRALSSDDRERTVTKTMNPAFEYASLQGDASDNVGQLSVSYDATNKRNYYLWTSSRSTLQDYDIYVKIPLAADFIRWLQTATENPLMVTYRSTSASSDDNQLDIAVFDTNGSPVTLSGSTTNLANTSWTTSQIEFTGSPTWTAAQDMLLKFTVSAKSDYQIHLGGLKLQFMELLQ